MKKVLVLGAGLVSRPLVHYLLDHGFVVTVATRTVSKAQALLKGHANGRAVEWVASDTARLDSLVQEHDLAISLLPAPLHPTVASLCVRHRRHMVTTSYVSPQMRALDEPARSAEIILLNEIGVDPGIDHMSAMRVIKDVERRGGRVVGFKSYCGGLPAPEACDNPWGYKFSWSPRGVCTAGKNPARWLEDGRIIEVPGVDLFLHHHPVPVEGVPGHDHLEGYPNRDSLGYIELYGLRDMQTMFRGTLRYPGWSACMKKVVDFGYLDETPVTYPAGMTFAQWTASLRGWTSTANLREQVARYFNVDAKADFLDRWEWLGLFSDEVLPITGIQTTALDVLAKRMEQRMQYKPGERDMIVLMHQFVARFDGAGVSAAARTEHIRSTLVDFGIPGGDTSMARTVSLPAAIATRLILEGRIQRTGVVIPVFPEIYNPVLDELETMGIRCVEKTAAAGC